MRTQPTSAFCACAVFVIAILNNGACASISKSVEVDISQHPYTVSIERDHLHHCAGTIINQRFVITTAHCFNREANYSVRAGSSVIEAGGSVHDIAQLTIHPNYTNGDLENDVALLQVSPEFSWSSSVKAVEAAPPGSATPPKCDALLVGWGHTKRPGEALRSLRGVRVRVLRRGVCQALERGPDWNVLLCGAFTGPHADAYVGDEGSPLVCQGALIGVTSWRLVPATPSLVGVFASAQALGQWIDSHVAQTNATLDI